ncbi:MAG: NfeD family protein [Lachnospiraceae bacterium]|jgi:membrane protein implicated in regulation of membrane protease activity|nr:NfeD family protein [Lachnospiraceae bacterium]
MDGLAVFWLILFVLLVLFELVTMGLSTVWFAGGALVATVAAVFDAPIWLQVVLFLTVSILLLYFTRPLAVKHFNRDRTKTNVEGYIGRDVIVISEIDNLQGIGQVNMGGQEWSARTLKEGITLPVGAVGVVRCVDGVKLIIEEKITEPREEEEIPE